jgi:hypothetical protein
MRCLLCGDLAVIDKGTDVEARTAEHQEQEMDPSAQQAWKSVASQVEVIWGEVFRTADKILKVHLKFGFQEFTDKISPSIEDIILSLKAIEALLDGIHHVLDYSEQRLVSNSKQQILWVQDLAEALKYNDEPRYTQAIEKLTKQAVV